MLIEEVYLKNKFILYKDEEMLKYYTNENIEVITIARLLAYSEFEYLKHNYCCNTSDRLRVLKLIEYNIVNDIINKRFKFNDYVTNKFKKEINKIINEKDNVLKFDYTIRSYEDLYKRFKSISSTTFNDNSKAVKLSNEFIDTIIKNDFNSSLDQLADDIHTINYSFKVEYIDKIKGPISICKDGGYIILDGFIKNNAFLFNDYIAQICRSTYYLDLLIDLFVYYNGNCDSYLLKDRYLYRVIELGIDKDSYISLPKLSSDKDILKSLYKDLLKYLSIFSLLMSTRIVTEFEKIKCSSKTLRERLDISYNDSFSVENVTELLKSMDINTLDDPILYTLKTMMEYNYVIFDEVLYSLMCNKIRNSKLLSIYVIEEIDYFMENDIRRSINGNVDLYVDASYISIDSIKKNIVSTYINDKYTSITFVKDNNNKIINNYTSKEDSLKSLLVNTSTESLINIFKDSSKIYNKVMASLIESGRSANIIQYNNELYKEPINGMASYININNTPYGKMIFVGKFDNTDRLRELTVNLIDNNDIELNYFIEILSDSISLILQSCYDYKESFNKICKLLKKFSNINLIQFTYKSNMIFEKEYNIYNICDLLYYVLQELEYLYMLNKYGEPNTAISNMKSKFLLEENNNE